MASKTHSKPLYLHITNVNGRMNKFTQTMAQGDFDNLDSAIVCARKVAHTCKAKVVVYGRNERMHYMCDGNF